MRRVVETVETDEPVPVIICDACGRDAGGHKGSVFHQEPALDWVVDRVTAEIQLQNNQQCEPSDVVTFDSEERYHICEDCVEHRLLWR